jgi:hypothetical protein
MIGKALAVIGPHAFTDEGSSPCEARLARPGCFGPHAPCRRHQPASWRVSKIGRNRIEHSNGFGVHAPSEKPV